RNRTLWLHGKQVGLSAEEVVEYLEGFNYHIGEREKEAMRIFRRLVGELEPKVHQQPSWRSAEGGA
ncbi:MAG TPA: hypothetical protein VIH68_07890, partial [Bacteroidota bacterium]